MKNLTIIYGPQHCGKTLMAKIILHNYSAMSDAVMISAGNEDIALHTFFFEKCEGSTELIIIDDCKEDHLHTLLYFAEKGIRVQKRGQWDFTIHPKIIALVSTEKCKLPLPPDVRQCRVDLTPPAFIEFPQL